MQSLGTGLNKFRYILLSMARYTQGVNAQCIVILGMSCQKGKGVAVVSGTAKKGKGV